MLPVFRLETGNWARRKSAPRRRALNVRERLSNTDQNGTQTLGIDRFRDG